jgi:hypothetical protein
MAALNVEPEPESEPEAEPEPAAQAYHGEGVCALVKFDYQV